MALHYKASSRWRSCFRLRRSRVRVEAGSASGDRTGEKIVLEQKEAALGGLRALAGFGIGFAIGAPSTGYFTDRDDPSVNGRLAIGSGMGLFSARIGAGIGAMAGGIRHMVIYRNR